MRLLRTIRKKADDLREASRLPDDARTSLFEVDKSFFDKCTSNPMVTAIVSIFEWINDK